MMCEVAGEGDARTGSVSATFTLSGQVNATLRASSHSFQNTGAVWLGRGKGEKREQKGAFHERRREKRGCSLNRPGLLGIGFILQMILQYTIFSQYQCRSMIFTNYTIFLMNGPI